MPLHFFPPEYFERIDPGDDAAFYTVARKVVHIDKGAIAALGDQFRSLLPPGGVYLDLMSSWRSHIPAELNPARVVGLGMNADEMADNPALSEYTVQNLNQTPQLPYADDLFDAAMCTVSVQYLTQPVAVFREVNRVLKPGGVFVVSFSNRCFPSKAVAVWHMTTNMQHMALVTQYFESAGNWRDIGAWYKEDRDNFLAGDPLYMVWGCRAK